MILWRRSALRIAVLQTTCVYNIHPVCHHSSISEDDVQFTFSASHIFKHITSLFLSITRFWLWTDLCHGSWMAAWRKPPPRRHWLRFQASGRPDGHTCTLEPSSFWKPKNKQDQVQKMSQHLWFLANAQPFLSNRIEIVIICIIFHIWGYYSILKQL